MALLSTPSKVFSRIFLGGSDMGIDTNQRPEQAGFRPGRGTTDQSSVPPKMTTLMKMFEVEVQCAH